MATLHVRNFPDALYARLRASAAGNGRSIGAEAIFHLQSALIASMTAGYPRARRRRGAASTPFEHFSPRARQVVADAADEARELGHESIGTEHLVLGLLREPPTQAARVLEAAGLTLAEARLAVEAAVGRGDAAPGETLPFTPGAKKAMELALRACLDSHASAIWPYHLHLGIVREGEDLGARLLAERGLDAETVRGHVASIESGGRLVVEADDPFLVEAEQRFRVVELEGDAAAWETQLNDLAKLGFQLVQIVEKRAIFSGRGARGVDRGA